MLLRTSSVDIKKVVKNFPHCCQKNDIITVMTVQSETMIEHDLKLLKAELSLLNKEIVITCQVFKNKPSIGLTLLYIPKTMRRLGYGNLIMGKLINIADKHHLAIILSPDGGFGTSPLILEHFYSKHGFEWQTPQKMVRVPKKLSHISILDI